MKLTVQEILKVTGGKLIQGNSSEIVTGISTDSRKIQKDEFYLALKGKRFDGHQFVEEVSQKAHGVIIENLSIQKILKKNPSLLAILVPNTLKALGDIACAWRQKFNIPVIAITGSSGKTSTKEMLSLFLSTKGKVCKTEGNLNNLIGLPLTLFTLNQSHQFVVLEMGMNAFGEIRRLTQIAQPTIGLITNVGAAHLEGVGDLDGVARAKGELFEELDSKAYAVINLDCQRTKNLSTKAQRITYSIQDQADVWVSDIEFSDEKNNFTIHDHTSMTRFSLPVVGFHHLTNFVASYTVSKLLGVGVDKIQKALGQFQPVQMRGEEIQLSFMTILNDCYNANPDSMKMALENMKLKFPSRRKIAVLGSMLELGSKADEYHYEVGSDAKKNNVEILFAYGPSAEKIQSGFSSSAKNVFVFQENQMDQLLKKLEVKVKKDDVVLIKGSRGMKLERVLEFFYHQRK
ncbi:MAG: hypothetical protein A3G32_00350 [Deltaproteobacteria bacterium RIFCSPLOWO2_12_FULL_40_28]|nr:MAG: hypothetical protein A3C45_03505 [Deltaproteobacteria bacterium RIFCSPHIGHO2_02_FULL_40_28]OGQ19174.1 MAG: hypothetical protein A3E27_02390 [Deltaproteobacteria bacterium RIFCSPHIGHO2_12_FULL_40_32]OGQ39790.1 MAG: hypothetical protein A3I69_07465 [Deltaproteobacteria bacterium RIFCSPLOWO2_02_FULL_40_36]OGQ53626.1 MAG: hypothetical protein A3G32_00350 [Deltaproteobacteria bacterium RIFCSPLOWO2_12_FULL_40_28]